MRTEALFECARKIRKRIARLRDKMEHRRQLNMMKDDLRSEVKESIEQISEGHRPGRSAVNIPRLGVGNEQRRRW